MKKRIGVIATIIALVLMFFTTFCYATEIQPRTLTLESEPVTTSEGDEAVITAEGDEVTAEEETEVESEIIYSDFYWMAEEDYEMSQTIDGNAYILADGDVKITGRVYGAVFILASGTVEVATEGEIADALYVVADSVKIDGIVYDIYSAGNKFELMENGFVSRDVKALASDMKLRGTIYRDVYLSGENIDVKDETTQLFIGGNFNYSSTSEIEGLQDVVQYGEVNFTMQEEEVDSEEPVETLQDTIIDYVVSALTSVVYVLVIFGILKLISPKFIEKTGKDLKEKGIVAFTVGLLSWVIMLLAIVASIILLFTPIGAPVAIIMWIAMLVILYTSPAVLAIAILDIVKQKAEKIRKNIGLEIVTLIGIAICVWLVQQLPYIGGIASLVVVTIGIGLIIRNIRAKIETKIETTTETVAEEQTETTEKTETTGEDTNTPE